MRRTLGLVALFLLSVSGVLVTSAAPACACSCAVAAEDEHERQATLIFEGDAVAVDDLQFGRGELDEVRIKFQVGEVSKGRAGDVVYVNSNRHGASCGAEFKAGHRYRVYAQTRGDALVTGLCAGNKELGAGGPIEEAPAAVVVGSAVGGVGLLALGAVWLVRRRRRAGPAPTG